MIDTETMYFLVCGIRGCRVTSIPYDDPDLTLDRAERSGWYIESRRPHGDQFCPAHAEAARAEVER